MSYWLIALVVMLALAPLLQFLPSRRQRHQAQLREAAALAGLFVEYRDLPLPPQRRGRLPAAERQVIYYGRRLPPSSRRSPRRNAAWWREGGHWTGPRPSPAPPGLVAELPAGALAIGCSEASCGCYWREEGDLDDVAKIAALLQRWAAELAAAG